MRRECFTRAWLRHCLLRGESPRALRMKWNRCRPTLSCGLRPAVPAALRLACDRPFYSTSGAQCVIRPSASRLSASCAQLRIHTVCLLSLASTVCVRPARRPSGHCHARPSARVSSTGLETQGPEASLLLLQRNLVYAPLRSAHHRELLLVWLFFCGRGKKLAPRDLFYPPGGGLFWIFLQATAVGRAASCPDARAPASMWHAGPRIGDGYRKLSLKRSAPAQALRRATSAVSAASPC